MTQQISGKRKRIQFEIGPNLSIFLIVAAWWVFLAIVAVST